MTESQPAAPRALLNERASLAIVYVIVPLMLACVAVPLIGIAERIVPDWRGTHLLPALFLIALEGMVSWRAASRFVFPSGEWFFYRATEAVVIFGGLKLYLYAIHGWDQLWRDLPLWSQSLTSFVTPEYLFSGTLAVLAWATATRFAHTLGDLEGDEFLAGREPDSRIDSDRGKARRSLLADIFILGGFMLFVTAVLRQNLAFFGVTAPPLPTGLLNVVVYFLLGLVLLAQSQFAVLRARWMIDRVPINTNIAGRWALYSALLLLACAALVIFIPTQYSLGLLDTLGVLYSLLQIVLAVLLFIIFIPIQFLANLFGLRQDEAAPQAAPELEALAPGGFGVEAPWFEIVRSLLFWAFFLLVVGFSLYYYLSQRTGLLAFLPRLRWPKLKIRLPALPRLGRRLPGRLPAFGFISLRRLSARDRVRYYYRSLLRRSDVPRQPAQTPYEYRRRLGHLPPDEVDRLTEAFVEAQYTPHNIAPPLVDIARRSWEQLRKALRSVRRT